MSEENIGTFHQSNSAIVAVIRYVLGGVLMGLANLVPGISGGTMLLAVGVYPQFINSVAEVSMLKFRMAALVTIAGIVGAAFLAIVALAGPVSELVIHHRWVMYSVFIGLTLGGVPVIWRLVKPVDSSVIVMATIGIIAMALIAVLGHDTSSTSGENDRAYAMLLLAGIAGGAAMILPGVSGGYILLILGQYVTILVAIDDARSGVSNRDWSLITEAMHVIIPVGIGVVVGVVGVSNLVRLLLKTYERATLGFLMGLLLGAVLGLWPFSDSVQPVIGDVIKGIELTTQEMVDDVKPKDWPSKFFTPTLWHIAGSLGLILVGFGASIGIGRLGNDQKQ